MVDNGSVGVATGSTGCFTIALVTSSPAWVVPSTDGRPTCTDRTSITSSSAIPGSGSLHREVDRAGHVGEEVVPLVVDHDEGGEVPHLDLPDRLHAELLVLEHLDLGDAVLGEHRGRAADRPEVEAPIR